MLSVPPKSLLRQLKVSLANCHHKNEHLAVLIFGASTVVTVLQNPRTHFLVHLHAVSLADPPVRMAHLTSTIRIGIRLITDVLISYGIK